MIVFEVAFLYHGDAFGEVRFCSTESNSFASQKALTIANRYQHDTCVVEVDKNTTKIVSRVLFRPPHYPV